MIGDTLRLVSSEKPRKAEVRNLGVHVHVQQDVARFEITVDYLELRVFVQVLQAPSYPVYDAAPHCPVQLFTLLSVCSKEIKSRSESSRFNVRFYRRRSKIWRI
jgi:hypothetical protein